ncbi:cysteine proteinase [Dacryopinax primogenitus]|uniref:Ubiquitin carboxyl-terminal hydrolase n=1 Tax=Dacryopinax primogenitus (strain DJM 731) TaxID=1858805 RepID=M5GD51_DACPD|nr:cysteine proteinase [Dacryopinax primogenitus]EJU02138.1 cysteine proteinase [Dacryopinax primogenitus]
MATNDGHPQSEYQKKHYVPLESDPDVFTNLIHNLGASRSLGFVDVLSLTDPDLLAFVPRPVLALILVFPDFGDYAVRYAKDQANILEYEGCGEGEEVVWFQQTIGNACGLYAILHAVCNGKARGDIDVHPFPSYRSYHLMHLPEPDSPLARLLQQVIPLPPTARARALESSTELEAAHRAAALQGQTAPPDAEDEVDHHYICFVRSAKNGHLYQMDGMLKGPVDLGQAGVGDLMSEEVRRVVGQFLETGEDGVVGFSLLALVENQE